MPPKPTEVPAVDPLVPQVMRISRVRRETADTFTFELEPNGGTAGFPFLPGQFNMLYAFGAGEVPISISGDPGRPGKLVHTIRAVGTVTRVLERLKAGAGVGVRGPYGTAWPLVEAEARDVVLVAGGIGLAPLRPAIYHLLRHRHRYGRIAILYGARTPDDLLYGKELETWRGRFDIDLQVTVDRAGAAWRGPVGVVTGLFDRIQFDRVDSIAMLCGPEVMMRYAVRELTKLGLDRSQIHLSMERNMQCAVGFCGHCQYGPDFVCKDGPVFPFPRVEPRFYLKEV